jgi:hypothetical protein
LENERGRSVMNRRSPLLKPVAVPRGDTSSLSEDVLPPERRKEYVFWLTRQISRQTKRTFADHKAQPTPAMPDRIIRPGPQSHKKLALEVYADLYPNGPENRQMKDIHGHLREILNKQFDVVISERQLRRYGIKKGGA